ncbi:MAG: beta-ketoacyl-ACP synthase II [Chitinivibrionales bacterium]|nr:beta-ketoacyl-ACP synthase II [Chitinivibrionales bacterium]MBD3395091.1 beta-ketoacyl-ACP synthase II [Chitinivibrionales bacterium]
MPDTRIVITGLGVVSPIGTGSDRFWAAAVKGTNGVRPLSSIDTTDYKTKTGGEVLDFDPAAYLEPSKIKHMGRSSQFAIAAAKEAVRRSGIEVDKEDPFRMAVCMGTTMGEPQILDQGVRAKYDASDTNAIPPDLPRQYPCSVIPTNVARELGAKGYVTIIPTACAAGNYAIGYAFDLLHLGKADVVLAGGSDPFSSIAFTGFNRLLATTPDLCRPFDRNRSGMAVSEGAGMVVVERLDHALKRNAPILAEVLGYGLACDAFKMTIPDPTGSGGIRALGRALANARVAPESVDYINAHGTGTGENDKTETLIAKTVLGERAKSISMSSTKSMIGHTMGAASAIEACACVQMLNNNIMLPTINYQDPDPDCDIDCVPNTAREADLNIVISNAYAFAGNCSSLVLGKYKG